MRTHEVWESFQQLANRRRIRMVYLSFSLSAWSLSCQDSKVFTWLGLAWLGLAWLGLVILDYSSSAQLAQLGYCALSLSPELRGNRKVGTSRGTVALRLRWGCVEVA